MNKNLKGDLIWAVLLSCWAVLLIVPVLRDSFIGFTEVHPYVGGFIKFFVLASMGDLLGARILNGQWVKPNGFIYKAIVWGCLGIVVTLVFTVFFKGVAGAMEAGRLPFAGNVYALAFFGSATMNLTFGPMMYVYHKFADLYVDVRLEGKKKVTVKELVDRVDWYGLVSFSWMKTCLFIWIPLHTLVFLMPSEYRVLASAFLSILLGVIIALSKKSSIALVNSEVL